VVPTEIKQLEDSKIAQKFNIPVTEFKASYGWVRQFLSRWQLSVYRSSAVSQKLPKEFEEKVIFRNLLFHQEIKMATFSLELEMLIRLQCALTSQNCILLNMFMECQFKLEQSCG
jgi:hypothetical protein